MRLPRGSKATGPITQGRLYRAEPRHYVAVITDPKAIGRYLRVGVAHDMTILQMEVSFRRGRGRVRTARRRKFYKPPAQPEPMGGERRDQPVMVRMYRHTYPERLLEAIDQDYGGDAVAFLEGQAAGWSGMEWVEDPYEVRISYVPSVDLAGGR